MTNEAVYSRKIQNSLRKEGWYVVKYHGNQFAVKGTPDLLVCAEGLFFGIELKTKKGIPSELQLKKKEEIEKAGGCWIASYDTGKESVSDIINTINNKIKERKLLAVPFKLLV